MNNSDIFLDTCVILGREFSRDREKAKAVEKFLNQKNMVTSTYVNMELNRTYYKDSYTLYTMLQEHTSLDEVKERIKEMHFQREKERLELIFERITDDNFELHEAKIRLKRLIKVSYHTLERSECHSKQN